MSEPAAMPPASSGDAAIARLRGIALLNALTSKLPTARARAAAAVGLAEQLASGRAQLEEATLIAETARLQEIGLIYVEAEILAKPAEARTPQEQERARTHQGEGAALARGAGIPESACRLLELSRERWDGSGPEGLASEQIPIGARILAVVGTYLDAGAGIDGATAVIEASARSLDPQIAADAAELGATAET